MERSKKLKDILIYGAGENCMTFFRSAILDEVNIVGIVDRDKCGTEVAGIKVGAPKDIHSYKYDELFVTPMHYDKIVSMLEEDYGVERDRIVLPGEINNRYILPRISEHENVFLTSVIYETCFPFVFRRLEEEGRILVLCLLAGDKAAKEDGIPCQDKKLFIFLSDDIMEMRNNNLLNYLKEMYPNAKNFLWFCNPCDDRAYGIPDIFDSYQSVNNLKKEFDYCYTYHIKDAEKYGFSFYPQFYPNIASNYCSGKEAECEVFFVGNAKDRFPIVYRVFKRLTGAGIDCRFYIIKLAKEDRIYEEGLIYIDHYISYEETLRELAKAKCILEICNCGDETSYRFAEAVIFGKRLLVNDDSVTQRGYYSEENIQVFHNADDIDTEWFKTPMKAYDYKGDFEPEYYFEKVLEALN